jgi:uncharacterized RDD family membrane protein YckC
MELHQPAGFWRRFGAVIIDAGVGAVIGFFIGPIFDDETLSRIAIWLYVMAYYILVPYYWNGYTVGKRVMGVRIVRIDGAKLGFKNTILRMPVTQILYTISFLTLYLVTVFMIIFRKDKRAIHDFVAGTYVTTEKP